MTAGGGSRAHDRPTWLLPASLALSLAGLLVSAYLTYEHFTANTTLACPAGGAVDCAKVTTSAWATFVGVPVALLGVVFFVAALALCLPGAWRRSGHWWDTARLAWVSAGLAMALYLVWAELFRVQAICLWCTAVHATTFLLWVVVLFGQILSEPPSS